MFSTFFKKKWRKKDFSRFLAKKLFFNSIFFVFFWTLIFCQESDLSRSNEKNDNFKNVFAISRNQNYSWTAITVTERQKKIENREKSFFRDFIWMGKSVWKQNLNKQKRRSTSVVKFDIFLADVNLFNFGTSLQLQKSSSRFFCKFFFNLK